MGTFDGNGKTIYNLHVDLDKLQTTGRIDYDDYDGIEATYDEIYHRAGLFGQLKGATIKNLTIENVIIHAGTAYQGTEGMFVGVLAGVAADSHFENIKIKGIVIVTADGSLCKYKYGYLGGLVGNANACTFKDITIDVDGSSYIDGSDCMLVGGVVGRYLSNNGLPHQFENIKSNLNVIASNPKTLKKTAVGGLIGEITNYTRQLTNCSCSATVTLNNYAGTLVDIYNDYNMAIGGLVGTGYGLSEKVPAVFTNCSFTGYISSNYISSTGISTNCNQLIKDINNYWEYMGWKDGDPWTWNTGCVTVSTSSN
jgi:hypothetical protein